MPPLDKDEQPRYKNTLIATFAIIGFILICVAINATLSANNTPIVPQEIIPTPAITEVITTIPTITPIESTISQDPTTTTTTTTTIQPSQYFITKNSTAASPPQNQFYTISPTLNGTNQNITQATTITAPSKPSSTFIFLNYTFKSTAYRIGIPKDDKLENIYLNHETTYVCTKYGADRSPCSDAELQIYYMTYITDPYQDGALNDIINTIQKQTTNTDDQARIAISLVQQIPYDTVKASSLTETTKMRYPYQVLYENKGICSEKSLLLASLLKKLGYGVVLFHYGPEKHMTIGIKSPMEYAYIQSGYAFIETTTPTIPTDSTESYNGIGHLISIPIIYMINEGRSMDSISQEYNDNIRFQQISAMGNELPEEYYYEWKNFTIKYGLVFR